MPETQLQNRQRAKTVRMRFSKTSVGAVTCPAGKSKHRVFDTEKAGLALVVTGSGNRAYYFYGWDKARGRPIEQWIADANNITPEDARKIVDKNHVKVANEIDLRQEKIDARQAPTLRDVWTTYRAKVAKAPRTMAEDLGLWNRYLSKWENKRPTDISEEACQRLYNTIHAGEFGGESPDKFGRMRPIKGGPSAARHALKLLREIYGHKDIKKTYRLTLNPAAELELAQEDSCNRYLLAEEFPAFWTAVEAQPDLLRDVIKIALFTAQRRSVLLAMEWAEVNMDFATWTIPANKMKSKKAHVVPLVPQAMEILKRRQEAAEEGQRWVFDSKGAEGRISNPEKALSRINAAAKLTPPISLHDLRRTTATWANSTGASEATIAAFLAHKHRSVTGIYAKATADTMRTGLANAVNAMLTAAGVIAAAAPAAPTSGLKKRKKAR